MIDKRTEAEIKMFDLVEKLQDFFSRKVGRPEFQEMLGELRDIKVLLINKQLGCWSGRHASDCICTQEHAGKAISHYKKVDGK
jgi:hypothetical protein